MTWLFGPEISEQERSAFSSPEATFALSGEEVNFSKTNYTQRIQIAGHYYYVKRYYIPGKHLRRYLGRSRVWREWWNLDWFERHNIPTPKRIAMGQGNRWWGGYWGVIVTAEAPVTIDLKRVYCERKPLLDNRAWRLSVLTNLARILAKMHAQGFIHNDLQWRNILVGRDNDQVYIIDCPSGRRVYLFGNRRGAVRDLAFLDKMAKVALSKTDRLRFYMIYRGATRLRGRDKREIRRVLGFLGDEEVA